MVHIRSKVIPLTRHNSFIREIKKNIHYDSKGSVLEVIRLRIKKFIASHIFGTLYINSFLALSVVSCIQSIYQTYLNEEKDQHLREKFDIFELVLASLFAFDWSLNLFLADRRWEHFWSFFSLIDFATVIPIWFIFFVFKTPVYYDQIHTVEDAINYAMHGARALLILRVLRIHKKLLHIEDEVKRHALQLTLSVVVIILFNTAAMRYLESDGTRSQKFHTWLYFMIVSITTVGYGDVTPESGLGRTLAMSSLCLLIIWVPKQVTELMDKMNQSSIYARSQYKATPSAKHVLVCGDLSSINLLEFFSELFHDDHEKININAVVLHPDYPTPDMYDIIIDPLFSYFVHYLEGSPLKDEDLQRACAQDAIAVFIMSNKFDTNPDVQDAKTILQYTSIRRFINHHAEKGAPMFGMQLIRPENRRHVIMHDPDGDKELVVCLYEVKMGLVAKTCMYPGTSTLLFNLLISFAIKFEEIIEKASKRYIEDAFDGDDSCDVEDSQDTWYEEYKNGCEWEIYTTKLSSAFSNKRFIDVAHVLYEKLGVVLFALRIRELIGSHRAHVILNPAGYVIPSPKRYAVEGFVIARNKLSSDLSSVGLGGAGNAVLADITTRIMHKVGNEAGSDRYSTVMGIARPSTPSTADGLSSEKYLIENENGSNKATCDQRKNQNQIPSRSSDARKGSLPEVFVNRLAHWKSIARMESNSSTSEQERLHKMEDKRLKEQFFMNSFPMSIAEATIQTSLEEEYPNLRNHMILISGDLNHLYDFIHPFRQRNLGKLQYIVLLTSCEIPHDVWSEVSVFEGILIVRGNPHQVSAMRNAGIFRASHVVILADPPSDITRGESSGVDAIVDADAIFTYHLVKKLNDRAHVVIEIVCRENVRYLDPYASGECDNFDFRFTSHFASGGLFLSGIVDTIIPQAFYNPHLLVLLNKLIVSDYSNSLLSEHTGYGVEGVIGSSLYQIPMLDNMVGKTYGALFQSLCADGMLPMGLYRGVFANVLGAMSNTMPYVLTNPPQDTKLYACDRVFVLSQTVPRTSTQNVVQAAVDVHSNRKRTEARIAAFHDGENGKVESLSRNPGLFCANHTSDDPRIGKIDCVMDLLDDVRLFQGDDDISKTLDTVLHTVANLKSDLEKKMTRD